MRFRPTANKTQCSSLSIVGDHTYEDDEYFGANLIYAGSSRIILLPNRLTITIIDEDCKRLHYF